MSYDMNKIKRFEERFSIEYKIRRIKKLMKEGNLKPEQKKNLKQALKDLKREGEKLYE